MKMLRLLVVSILVHSLANAQSSQQQTLIKQEWDAIRMQMYAQQDSLLALHKTFSDSLFHASDAASKKELTAKVHALDKAIEQVAEKALLKEFDLVKRNLSSPIALDILALEFNRKEGKPFEMFYSLFYSLSKELQNSKEGKVLLEALFHCQNSAVGQVAPDFRLVDIHQDTLSLQKFYGKSYVLIDFWASWCVPCRKDFPFLKQVYERYHDKGLEIINVSTDEDVEAWRKAIAAESIGIWRQVADKQNASSVAPRYFVTGIPVKVLIDKQGRIVARWRGSSQENKEALQKKLHDIFEQPNSITSATTGL